MRTSLVSAEILSDPDLESLHPYFSELSRRGGHRASLVMESTVQNHLNEMILWVATARDNFHWRSL
jgi:hypothetical protein